MNVSRETPLSIIASFRGATNNSLSYKVDLSSQEDLLPFFLGFSPGSYLLVEDSHFWSVFNIIYKSGLPLFSVLTDFKIDSPSGFVSPLKKSINNYMVYEKEPKRVVLINRSCFNGCYPYYFQARIVRVDSRVSYDVLLDSICLAGLVRVSSVVGPGTYTKRGSVIDFFPSESSFPVRVDFSYNVPKIFVFDTTSQLTNKEVQDFSFIKEGAAYQKIKTSDLISPLVPCSYFNGFFVYSGGKDVFEINLCKYSSYMSNSGPFVVSNFLHSVGFFLNDTLFLPPWFSGGGTVSKNRSVAASLVDGFGGLELGALLVHEEFGVCSFDGVIDGVDDESSVLLVFKDGKILLPVSRLFLLSIYGGPGGFDRLNSLSRRGAWTRKKGAVSKKINDFVQKLLDQHLFRVKSSIKRGVLDLDLLKSFLASFKYQDTVDQALAFQEILEDLSSALPMDRLLCGDVGFGKTEIAIRAAFVSVLLGGRVVVLAPTTILCYQLLDSFTDRLSPFAINVEMVSRLISDGNVQKSVVNFNSGKTDVLIGTHRIFSHIKDLDRVDLLVVDEEHRFGVKQKEVFVEKFPLLDVLSMSATPIPRSLQNAFSGVKAMSTISTPPINRLPIQTTIDYFNVEMIANYVKYEVSRSGQVYFLHNNVRSLGGVQRLLAEVCFNVSSRVVHGKMSAKDIEKNIGDFSRGDFQVLISTTIIESGLDISNVNTIIINNAHLFGLSQLHQIRGRVGRHSRQAYAYLLIPRSLNLNVSAKKRLKAIEENVALGSGYNLSSKDLEIRGAGSLFGYNQSGGAQIGFDLYNKILNSSLSSLRGARGRCIGDVVVSLSSSETFIPPSYVGDPGLRISLYKTLFSCSSFDALDSFSRELVNRFGVFPVGVGALLWSQELRILCLQSEVSSVVVNGEEVKIVFLPGEHLENPSLFVGWVSSFFGDFLKNFSFKPDSGNRLVLCFSSALNKKDIYVFLRNLLNKFREDFLETS